MQADEREEMNRLCLAVIQEKDAAKLTERVKELNDFLYRLERKSPQPTSAAGHESGLLFPPKTISK